MGKRNPVQERSREYRSNSFLVCREMSKFAYLQKEEEAKEKQATTAPQDHEDDEEEKATTITQHYEGDEDDVEDEKARYEWDFSISSIVSLNPSIGGTSDAIGVIELDPSDSILATGGSARKIRIYTLDSLVNGQGSLTRFNDHASANEYYICTPAKLSSLRWRPDSGGHVIGSGDYDGVVTEYDLEKRVPVRERDEHGGKRVWSIDYWTGFPSVGASGSDDGTVHVWDSRSQAGVAVMEPSSSMSPVCSVEFDQLNDTLMAVGSADRLVYVFDFRWTREPAYVFRGHRKPVSYVRFLGARRIVSAATDGSLKLWDLDGATHAVRTYRGHVNSRNFVGLSAWRAGGLLGCGSESNEVYVYDWRWKEPVWTQSFEPEGQAGYSDRFVSSVCWRQHTCRECTLVAGGSNGVLQVFTGKRKELMAT